MRAPSLVVGLAGVLVAARTGAAWAGPLDKPIFTATPAELLSEARAVAGTDAQVVVLRDDITLRYDEAGRVERRFYVVAAILKPAAVDDWGTIRLNWKPFYQERPTIRARVVGPDGKATEIDPALFHDSPAVSESPSVFSDRRVLEAPLPRLAVGAVFEEEFVIKDREPLLAAGDVDRAYVGRGVPVLRSSVIIDAPAGLKTQIITRGFARTPTAKKTTREGRTTWTYDFGRYEARERFDSALPGDVTDAPYVAVGTATSWAAVASDYQKLVDAKLAAPVTLPPGIKATSQRATVDKAVAWLHANVRYTGIELSDSAIIPFTPAETIARGFGDCKDKATLLVAMLRASGVPADLVLLLTGPGTDVDRALPGMGMFDHAIVRARVDGKDLWIDATESGLPAGQLPSRDQARLALIIAPSSRDLTPTPAPPASDNLVREVRTYTLSEYGHGSVHEVTTEHGVYWDNLRGWLRETKRAEVTKSLGEYAERQYSGALKDVTSGDPADMSKPFAMTVTVEHSRSAYTGREQADVYLLPTDTLTKLPDTLTSSDKEVDDALASRTTDYQWRVPHVYEIENRLIIPVGLSPPPVTASEKRGLGTMTLTTTRRLERDILTVTYRLDTGKRRITADQLRATRAAVQELQKGDAEHLIVVQAGAALAHAGKLEEAIAEYKRLIALHPKEGLHHGQLADAYHRAGMGAAARRAARRAVELEPTNGDAHVVLAFQLRKDTMGRELGWDADRAGAIAAYRKAIALAPDHVGALEDLASLLAVDRNGWPTAARSDLLEAIELLRRAKTVSQGTSYDLTIAERLLEAGKYAEAEAAARALPRTNDSSGIEIAAAAAHRGGPAAVAHARSLASGAALSQALVAARGRLMRLRLYDPMRAIHAELPAGTADAMEDAMMKALVRVELAKLDRADPRTPVFHAFALMTGTHPIAGPWDKTTGQYLDDAGRQLAAAPYFQQLRIMQRAAVTDLFMAMATMTIDGNASDGWRITAEIGGDRSIFYAAHVKGRAELIGAVDATGGVARLMRERIARKNLVGAARWLALVADDASRVPDAGLSAAAALYRAEIAGAGARPPRESLEVAAALLAPVGDRAIAIPILRRCSVSSEPAKQACRLRLGAHLEADQKWGDALEVSLQDADDEVGSVLARSRLMALAGRAGEGAALLDKALTTRPDQILLLQGRAFIVLEAEGWAKAKPWFDKVAAHRDADPRVINFVAWTRAYYEPKAAETLALVKRAEKMSKDLNPAMANTLATVEAEAGHPYAAWQYLLKSHPQRLEDPPHASDAYVLGRIAEAYGLRDDAIGWYRRVPVEPSEVGVPTVFEFAQLALKRLGAKP